MENFLVCLPAASGSAEADPADPPAATDNQLPIHGADTAAAGASGEPVAGCSAASDVQQRILSNPWPHLDIFLQFVSADPVKRTVAFKCLLCKPKTVVVQGHLTSLANLKSHVKRAHPK